MSSTVPLGTTEEACDFRPAMGFKGTLVIHMYKYVTKKTYFLYLLPYPHTYIYIHIIYTLYVYVQDIMRIYTYVYIYIYIHTSIHLSIDQESCFPSIKLLQQ